MSQEKSQEEYEAMRKSVMQKKSIDSISDEDLPNFVAYMNQYKMDCLDKEDYLAAKDAAAILDACKAENTSRQKKTETEKESENGPDTIGKKKAAIEEKIQKFDAETEEKTKALQENQNKELEEFETKWREEMPEKYRRVPKKLVELRETARTLGLAGHYDEAAARKAEADQLEIEEHKEAQNRLRHDYRVAKNKLLQKHQLELNKFNESRQEKRELYVAEVRNLEDTEKNRENVLKSKPFSNKKGVRDSQEGHSHFMNRSLPRKSHPMMENKLPPLKPPNDKEGSSSSPAKSQSGLQQTANKSPKPAPKQSPPPPKPKPQPEEQQPETSIKASDLITDTLEGDKPNEPQNADA